MNLDAIGNACKFNPEGTSVTLRAKEEDAALIVEVEDTGKGISEQGQTELFKPYHRLQGDGLGVGLALCKRWIELHGGRIWVNSTEGKGSVFAFSLPMEVVREIEGQGERGSQR